jgi:putative hydrolase of the HAD superfamily
VKISTITIDLWGTLFLDGPSSDNHYKKPRLAEFERLLGAAGLPASAAALDRAYDDLGGYLGRHWAAWRDVPVDDHVQAILAAIDPALPRRVSPSLMTALIDAYARPILRVPPAVDDGALATLAALSGDGYTLALVSNIMRTPGRTLRQVLDRFRLLGYFRHTTFSDEVRIRKPDPEIFALTLRAVGSDPAAAVHVGDDPVLDVRGARAAGMRVVQVSSSRRGMAGERPDQIITRLAELPDAIERLDA